MKYTKEDLMNTWGVVESKEHAEYIIELAASHGFELADSSDTYGEFFCFDSGSICFVYLESEAKYSCKQIKIPLPPKAKEWPKVDDEIEWGSGNIGIIKSLSDEFAWVKRSDNHQYTTIYASRIKKPKTPEEILIEELHQKLLANNCSDECLLACDIVQGKIEGLSYE